MRPAALITGASCGLGAAFARRLAATHDLVLVARRLEALQALASHLSAGGVQIECLSADLCGQEGLAEVEKRLQANERNIDMLINNAGFGSSDTFRNIPLAAHLEMIHLHVVALMRLCHSALPSMLRRKRGAIINVSSINALLPSSRAAVYGGTKAFVKNFSEGLRAELWASPIRIQVLCPGFTETEFHSRIANFKKSSVPSRLWMSADDVVNCSLKSLKRNQPICIPGLKNRLLVLAGGNPWIRNLLWQYWILASRKSRSRRFLNATAASERTDGGEIDSV